jgi:S-adenosylmethionine:tRNA ribosyltransferase-isomerase
MNIKTTPISLFDYDLPENQIAQTPAIPRESAKLMVLSKTSGSIEHKHVFDLPNYIKPDDIIIINNTKVFKARLLGTLNRSKVELFLIKPINQFEWLAIGKPGKKFKPGVIINIAENFNAKVIKHDQEETMIVSFDSNSEDVIKNADLYGHVPIPPYIKTEPKASDYQTSYAKVVGSVAAPTAGFHLTTNIRHKLFQIGVEIYEITLHVGLGTFLPVKSKTVEEHKMHSEWVNIASETANAINIAKSQNRRIIAVGTTTVRTLEGIAKQNNGKITPYTGDVNLFITPGFKFNVIDAMLTNFHLPKSTLIILVSAFSGRKNILNAYHEAIQNNYRFFSFGDAMLII